MDPGHSGQYTIEMLFSLASMDINAENIHHLKLISLSEKDIEMSWNQSLSGVDEWRGEREGLVRSGIVKRYFDYQWAVNSLPIFTKLLHDAGLNTDVMLTKFHLLAAMLLGDQRLTWSALLSQMHHYRGTGKYGKSMIGSPASSAQIVTQLCQMGIFEETNKDNCPVSHRNIMLSEKGRFFLDRIHKKTKDRDLPGRLQAWMGEVYIDAGCLDGVTHKIDRYIKTLFGKQKNFMAGLAKLPPH